MITRHISTYSTRKFIALEVSEQTARDGRITFKMIGKHGAGSGLSLKDTKHAVSIMLSTRKGIKLTNGVDFLKHELHH